MANLKLDLLNKLRNDKYYEELELVRLAGDANMNYKEKIDSMDNRLLSIAMINTKMGLAEQYFQEPAPQPAPQQPQGQVHQGQTHGE